LRRIPPVQPSRSILRGRRSLNPVDLDRLSLGSGISPNASAHDASSATLNLLAVSATTDATFCQSSNRNFLSLCGLYFGAPNREAKLVFSAKRASAGKTSIRKRPFEADGTYNGACIASTAERNRQIGAPSTLNVICSADPATRAFDPTQSRCGLTLAKLRRIQRRQVIVFVLLS